MRVIARGDHQLEAHVVGLAFVVAREGEDARYGRQLDQWTDESDSGCTGEGGEEDRCCRLGAKIAELLHGVPSHVMADLMAKNVGDLRLVLGVQEEACPDLHHSVGGHGGIHVWRLDDVNANTVAMRRGEATDERPHVAVQRWIGDDASGGPEIGLDAVHRHPQPRLVAVEGGALAGLEVSQRAGLAARRGAAGHEAQGHHRGEQPSGGVSHRGTSARSFLTADCAGLASRRSACVSTRRLNHTMSPVLRSTSEAKA